MRSHILCCLSLLIVSAICDERDKVVIIPNAGKTGIQKEAHGVTCKFDYECVGGTNEEWEMKLEYKSGSTLEKYTCSVFRPDGKSYLYFQHFKLSLDGPNELKALDVVVEGEGGRHLDSAKFIADLDKRQVSESKDFQSQLTKVVMYAQKSKKEEL